MNITDEWIMEHLPSTAPDMARIAMDECHRSEREVYIRTRMRIREKLKILERYGMVRWTGEYRMITNTAAKVYEVIP